MQKNLQELIDKRMKEGKTVKCYSSATLNGLSINREVRLRLRMAGRN